MTKTVSARPRSRGRPRKGAEHSDQELLDIALRVFAENGFGQASLRLIAEMAGVDVALLSYRFGSKLGLWTAVVENVAEESKRETEAFLLACKNMPRDERIAHISDALIAMISRRPYFSQLMIAELTARNEPDRKRLLADVMGRPILALLVDTLRREPAGSWQAPSVNEVIPLLAGITSLSMIASSGDFVSLLANEPFERERSLKIFRAIFRKLFELI